MLDAHALPNATSADAEYGSGHVDTTYRQSAKRSLDFVLSLLLLPILLPVIVVLYFFVRASGGPGFFGHVRMGKDGRKFRWWKLRTMVPDAEDRLHAMLDIDPRVREAWERDRKLRDDPRITRFGAFLRRTSLDELPQIFNVLKGDMSLVGPRPVTADELEKYGVHKITYLAMRPGVTGLWQVSGRNNVSYSERVAMDNQYFRDMSLVFDMSILVRTTGVVLRRTGL